jgi:hypothetical protein
MLELTSTKANRVSPAAVGLDAFAISEELGPAPGNAQAANMPVISKTTILAIKNNIPAGRRQRPLDTVV